MPNSMRIPFSARSSAAILIFCGKTAFESKDEPLRFTGSPMLESCRFNMRTKNKLPRLRDALSFSALLLLLPAVYPAQPADRFLLSPPAPQAGVLMEAEPQPGPQPPCGKEPIPAYPGVDELAIVKSWSRSDLGRDWKSPACTRWAEVGFTTLVTIAAGFRHTAEAGGLVCQ